MSAFVVSVQQSAEYSFGKSAVPEIWLVAGSGVEGDIHAGPRVRHRSRVAQDPNQPNLRQVHIIHAELFDEVSEQGFTVHPGDIGENITTRGVDLLGLPTGALLRFGDEALVVITGLRTPCGQINGVADGLLGAMLSRDDDGNLVRKSGVMGMVVMSGPVKPGDPIAVAVPPGQHRPLERV